MRKSRHNIKKALPIHNYFGVEPDNIKYNLLSNNTLTKYI